MLRPKRPAAFVATGMLAATLALVGCGSALPSGEGEQTQSEQTTAQDGPDGADEGQEEQASLDYLVLVNRAHRLPDGWESKLDLVEEPSLLYDDPVRVERAANDAFQALKAELAQEGVNVELDSCYRSVAEQQEVFDEFTQEYGEEYARRYVAVPGYSEHHTGLALDLFLVVDGEQVAKNEDMKLRQDIWDKVHARLADHGFILRYLPHKEHITGYAYEPWHIRYVADPTIAHEIMDAGLTFEEYLGEVESFAVEGITDAEYEQDLGTSETYSADDVQRAMDVVMATFNGWDGCRMKRIAYAGDEASTAALDYANSLRGESDEPFDQAIVIVSDFHSPTAEDAEGTAWEPDTDYNDYTWTLARVGGGGWRLLTWGYA